MSNQGITLNSIKSARIVDKDELNDKQREKKIKTQMIFFSQNIFCFQSGCFLEKSPKLKARVSRSLAQEWGVSLIEAIISNKGLR